MSHHPNVTTPAETPTSDRTVGELVAERPGCSRIFQTFQIDFCCQGGKTLRDACSQKGVDLQLVLKQLETERMEKSDPLKNPAELPPPELIEYIVAVHHEFLRRELPRLGIMAQRVAKVHGGHTPALVEVQSVFEELQNELMSHIAEEERVVFPDICALSRGEGGSLALERAMAGMRDEHEVAGSALARLRELTNDFQPPEDACNTYRALFAGLADLEVDLHRHIHLENSVLFPAASRLEGVREVASSVR